MCYTVSAEDMLTWALVKSDEGVSVSYVRRLSEVAQAKIRNCNFDVAASSLWAVVEYSAMFKCLDNNTIVFTNNYINKIDKIKETLKYTIPKKINEVLAESFI
ncbi:MAG TPA: hypothetical protein VIM70_20405 [Clostridium sp.]|uniref:hypothetical protein n=1 Tax=Clostridium sp. TaxID=1506 RepID=UPI002F93DA6F